MRDLWDGPTMADAIGRELETGGFFPFGTGVPFAAARAARAWLAQQGAEPPYNIADTCCGKCVGDTCYVDAVTGA